MEELPDDFDPRLEAFNNPNVRRYHSGLGAEFQDQIRSTNGELKGFKLHISKVHKQMNEIALKNLFSQCGNPTNVVIKKTSNPHFNHAFLEYGKLSEAEAAIRRFDKQDPYNLIVAVAQTQSRQYEECTIVNEAVNQALATDQQIAQLADNDATSFFNVPLGCKKFPDISNIIDPGALGRMFEQSINLPNNRKVSCGRGYSVRPPQNSRTSQRKNYIIREHPFARGKVIYSSGVEPPWPDNFRKQPCSVCGVLCCHVCFGCKEVSYCCPDCQKKDWPRHKLICRKILADSNSQNDSKSNCSVNSSGLNKHTTRDNDSKPSNSDNKTIFKETTRDSSYDDKKTPTIDTQKIQPLKRIEAGLVRNIYLSTVDSETEFWVGLWDDSEALARLDNELNERVTDQSPCLRRPEVGAWCCKRFDGKWARARVVSPEPAIMYVDYGNCESATLDQLKELPVDLAAEPPFAINVHYPEGLTPADVASPILFRFLAEGPDGLWTVEKAQPVLVPPTHRKHYFIEGEVYEVKLQELRSMTEMYVTKVDVLPELNKMYTDLNSAVSDSSPQLVSIATGSKCAVKLRDKWYRASVRQLEPLTCLCVDFGNEVICKRTDVKELPDRFRTRVLAAEVHLASKLTSEQLIALREAPVKLRVIKKDGRHWLCDFATAEKSVNKVYKDQQTSPRPFKDPSIITSISSEKPKFLADPNPELSLISDEYDKNSCLVNYKRIIDVVEEQEKLFCEVTEILGDRFLICIVRRTSKKELDETVSMSLGAPLKVPYRPQINEMVAVYIDDVERNRRWRRGVVLEERSGSYCVALVDYGLLIVSNNFRQLPDRFKQIPLMAVKLNSFLTTCIPSGFTIEVTLQKYSADVREWEVAMDAGSKTGLGVGQLTDWRIEPDRLHQLDQFATVEIKSGDHVTITAFLDIETIYVRPITPDYSKLYESIPQEVGAECFGAEQIDSDPLKGDLVAAKWDKNGNYYRAQILDKTDEVDTYKVLFVDYGNFDTMHISKMRSLSNKLKSIPNCAVKVGLGDVGAKTLTPTAFDYGIKLAETEEHLLIEFECLEKVKLTKVSDKTNINNTICELLKPSWMGESYINTSLALQKFPMRQDLPEPSVENSLRIGSKESVLVTYVPPLNVMAKGKIQLVVCKASASLVHVYNRLLRDMMKEYIASLPAGESYVPRRGELCICVAGDDHSTPFRAECIKILNSNTALLASVDFGEQAAVSFNKIYKMTSDMMQLAPYAIYCHAEGLPANVTYEKLIAAQSALDVVEAEVKDFKNEHFIICIPELNVRVSTM